MNFFYFSYTGLLLGYLSHKVENEERFNTALNRKRVRDNEILSSRLFMFSFCLSVAVNILYWSLVFINPSFFGDNPTPFLLEIFLHGGNMVVLLADKTLNSHRTKEKNLISQNFLLKFTFAYIMMQYLIYYTLNIEVYPMISKLTLPQFSMIGAAGYGLFMIGHFFHERIMVSV